MIVEVVISEFEEKYEYFQKMLSTKNIGLLIIKNFISKESANLIRNSAFQLFKSEVENAYKPFIYNVTENHVRIDCNVEKSTIKSMSQSSFFFPWNKFSECSDIEDAYRKLAQLRANFSSFSFAENTNLGYQYLDIRHYPVNGGYIQKHSDPPSLQKLVPMVILSQKGQDFYQGGLFLECNNQSICVDDHVSLGDLYVFYPQNIHWVEKIDPGLSGNIDWNMNTGRWVMFTPWSNPGRANNYEG